MKKILTLIALTLILAACTQTRELAQTPTTAVITQGEEVVEQEPTIPAANTAEPEPEAAVVAAPTAAAPPEETALPAIIPIEVTYFTPAQQEGPYYTLSKPGDRDNDLVEFSGAAAVAEGQIIEFGGTVYDSSGLPVEGLTIEIWQTDANGIYLHPGDPGTASRDPNFQFYGEAVTDAAGRYDFRTILPGKYEPRPPHIHFKVKLDSQELLTSQFYFAGQLDLQGEDAALLITAVSDQDAAGSPILSGERDIILSQPIVGQ